MPESSGSGVPARQAAQALLQAILWRGDPLEKAIARAFRKLENASDRGLARAIVSEVLRGLVDLDAAIDAQTRRTLAAESRARMVLRIALAQLWYLNTAPHAVVATALPLVEGGERRLVHGVLSALIKDAPAPPEIRALPAPWGEVWAASWGDDVSAAAARALAAPPPLDLTLRDTSETEIWRARLGGTSLMPGHVRIAAAPRVEGLDGFEAGAWWVQDLAASLPVRLLTPVIEEKLAGDAGCTALDLCAAPGGKTLQLAALGAGVMALDISEKRLGRLRENLQRTGLTAVIVAGDALHVDLPKAPDIILLDAPCSGTGIFRRHPDVLHIKAARNIERLKNQQAALLDRAAALMRPGARLLYCVCSLEKSEGEAQISAFLDRHRAFHIDVIDADELPAGLSVSAEGWVRTLPGDLEQHGGLDGFFMARIAKA